MSSSIDSPSIIDKTPVAEVEVQPQLTTVLSVNGEVIDLKPSDYDDALQYAAESENLVIDPVYEKKLVRKIDWYIMPMIAILMSCQMMDKTTNSYAAIMGLRTDLHMSAEEYTWVGSSFYLGYLVFEYPAGVVLQKWPLSKVLTAAILIWGIVLMCHAACQGAATFLLCRTLLGIFEGFMNPAYILLTSQWYKKDEQFMRTCFWYGSQGLGTLLGAGIAHGLYTMRTGDHTLASWRLFYIITGVITLVMGVISLFHIPDVPVKAWFLNETDKKYCVERSRQNQQGFGNHRLKTPQLIEAFKDPITYLVFIYALTYAIPNGGLNNFGSILLNDDFNFSTGQSMLMNMPGGGIDVIIPPAVAILNHKVLRDKRLISMILVNLLCVVGSCLLTFTSPKGSRLTGYYLLYTSTTCMAGMASIVSSNVAGHTKKVAVGTFFLIGYCVGNMIGPQTFRESQAPGYAGAKTAMLVSYCVGAIAMAVMYMIYRSRNNFRDKRRIEMGEKYVVPDNIAFADLTDMQNPELRYDL
ncbi:unnamed protein product [Kuraishia capsulata CBS 1993]|uniref:Major facilitator superfamily (MFS) profile domain-containing protein n=1 Tax=Kuraishia capsulata CBS 1993 TaxID=1382522 RepID=W6MLV5_9ASCO|nr:uncharacterized protein KUCA_T00003110001 [Kuraishia capsulata CBS 1993]CDK27133.1 unnamed protein product [Kuraishia capsulata CBS 1993]